MTEATLSLANPSITTPAPKRSARALLLVMILVVGVGVDQVSKYWAKTQLDRSRPISMAGDTFRIQYAENPGAFLGLGGTLSESTRFWLLTAVNAVFLLVICGILITHWSMRPAQFASLALLLAGGVGNLIDRITQDGLVIDFLNVGFGPVRTGIFNVADMAIMAGAGLLFWLSFQQESPDPEGNRES